MSRQDERERHAAEEESGYGPADAPAARAPSQLPPDPALQPTRPGEPPQIEPEPPDPGEPWNDPEPPEPPVPRPPELPDEPRVA